MSADTDLAAGQALRKQFDDALDKASKKLGQRLQWDEHELHALTAACNAADRRAELKQAFAAELAGDKRPAILVKLSAELRLLDKAIVDHLSRIRIGTGVAKSERHQRAVNARWRYRDEQRGIDGASS